MTTSKVIGSRQPLALAQAGFKREVKAIFQGGSDRARNALVGYAGLGGEIPQNRQVQARAEVKIVISDLFTAHGTDNAYGSDGVTPLAPYPALLNKWLAWSVYQAVLPHEQWMRQHVPADVFNRLRMGKRRIVSEQIDIFRPNPLAEIDPERRWVPPHKWTDERGYQLSDRIWRTDLETRRKIDELLARGLLDGQGALDLSRALEAYLLPGRTGIRTLAPYGSRFQPGGASFDAMRLARTEISRAFNSAALVAAQMNPYVETIDIARSANGDATCPICPEHATIGMAGERLRDPYDKNSADISPFHPHCLCVVLQNVTQNPDAVTAQLREELAASADELDINPSDAWAFSQMLLGDVLMNLLIQMGLHPAQEILF